MSQPPNQWFSLDAQVEGEWPPVLAAQVRDFWESPASGENPAASVAPTGRRLALECGPLPPIPAEASRATLTLMEQPVEAAWHGNELWAGDFYAQITGEVSRVRVDAEALAPAALNPAASQAACALVLTEIHRAGGWLPLHAAVLDRNGRAVAITGVSGAGKSTATLRLAALGYTVICEDRAFWHAPSGQVTGLDRCLRAFPDSLERFAPQLLTAALHGPRDAKGKLMLPLSPAGAATLTRVLLLSPDAASLDAAPLNAADRVRLAWETTGVPLTQAAREQVQRGVGALLPLLQARPVTRDTVLDRVKEILDS